MNCDLTQARLKQVLDYDPESGIFRWRVATAQRTVVGSVAGFDSNGYRRIHIDKKTYLLHRLAWLYVLGVWPRKFLDHRNLVRNDNRFGNLREATHAENQRNRLKTLRNASGFKGVCWHKHRGAWTATITFNKHVEHLGYFGSAEAASAAYEARATELFGAFREQLTLNQNENVAY